MTKDLERDLGLPAVMAISIGAMVGSGIFILPALALEMAGPAVVLAYLLAGVLVLPAALSKSEMATAMPEAGGTYVYIERSMGPLLGTIAGLGTWFALAFKGGLALVGGAPYIVLLLGGVAVEPVAVGLAAALIAVNLLGAKQTGRLQIVIVAVMLAAMGWFVVGSVGSVEPTRYGGFFEMGSGGLLAATGFVFVSYAGVTKIASVAEEIEDPGRNIPLGMLGSLAFTTVLYVLVVAVMIGAMSQDVLGGSNTPVADVARRTMASPGVLAVVAAAVLALVSTANAGLMSSSRYPFAMSRDRLVPPAFEHVSDRFNTPTLAILVTGGLLIAMILLIPIEDIAKLGSAFQILVFVLINLAVVAFRESDAAYDPEFRDPLYPWTQAFGATGGLVLLTQMGTLPLVGAVVIVAGSALWYLLYARPRVRREGVARDEIRRRVGRRIVERTRTKVTDEDAYDVVVAVTEETEPDRERGLVRAAADVASERDGTVTVVRFDEVPDQLPLEPASEVLSPGDEAFERRMADLAESLDAPLEYGELVSHDTRHAVVNYLEECHADLLVLEGVHGGLRSRLLGNDPDWITRHAPCDVLLIDVGPDESYKEVGLVTDRGPFDPLKVQVADALASAGDATLALVQTVPDDATEELRETVRDYHAELGELASVPVDSRVVVESNLGRAVVSADLVVVEGDDGGLFTGRPHRQVLDAADAPSVVVRPHEDGRPGPLGRLLERVAF